MIHPLKALRSWLLRGFLSGDLWDAMMKAFARSLPTDNPRSLDQMKANRGWAFAANRQIAGRAVRVTAQLYLNTRSADGAVEQVPVFDHAYLDLVSQPNCDETGLQFHWRKVLQLNTAGAAFVKVTPETTDLSSIGLPYTMSRIRELRLLDPDRVKPIHWRDQSDPNNERFTAGYEFTPYDGGVSTFLGAPFDRASRERWKQAPYPFVYRIVLPDAASIHGASPIQAAQHPVNVLEQLGVMHHNQLARGLHSDLIFYLLKDIDDPERFRQAVLMVSAGVAKAGEPMVVPKKLVEVAQGGRGNKDMMFVELAEDMRHQLLAVLGASDGMVGVSADVNKAVVEGLERILALGTVDPLNTLVADADNAWLLPLFRGQNDASWYTVKYGTSAGVDELTQTEILMKQTANAPIKTQNEARKSLNLGPRPEGDVLVAGNPPSPLPLVPNTAQLPMPKAKSNGHATVQLARCPRCRKVQKALDGECCGLPLIPQDVVLFDGKGES